MFLHNRINRIMQNLKNSRVSNLYVSEYVFHNREAYNFKTIYLCSEILKTTFSIFKVVIKLKYKLINRIYYKMFLLIT